MAHIHVHKYGDFIRHMFHNPIFWAILGIVILFGLLLLAVRTGGNGEFERYPYYYPYYGI